MRKPHTLTRACPHRWCRSLHRVLNAEDVVIAVAFSIYQLGYLAYLLAVTVLVSAVASLAARRSVADIAGDDVKKVDPADVRTGWANLAVSLDLAFAALGPIAVFVILLAPHDTMITTMVGGGPAATVTNTVGVCALILLRMAAHYLATQPRRRKRALVPATN
ncbi:hypothetical protein BOQ63_000435 (plasmid) [Streptomyces viridifaciens]|nr:hypothetical protein BOQ63_000435 [Streptomyces viridifaciens]